MNDLTLFQSGRPQFLQAHQGPSTADEFSGGVGGGFPLGVLSIRGKEFRLRKAGNEVPTQQREMTVVLVRSRPTVSKRYYASQYASGTTEAPDCASTDSFKPDAGVPAKQSETCAACPHNQFGSRITQSGAQGKACSDYKRMVVQVLDMGGGRGLSEPLVLDLPVTSLRAPRGYRGSDMMLGDYVTFVKRNGGEPHQLATQIYFTASEYPQLAFKPVRWLNEEEYKRVLELREHDDVETVLSTGAAEPAGAIQEQATMPAGTPPQQAKQETPAPAAAQAPAPQPQEAQSVEDLLGGAAPHADAQPAAPAQPEPTPAPAPAEPVAPVAGPEPAQAQAQASTASDEDVMAEIDKLLGG